MDSTIRKPNAILATWQQLSYSLVYSTAVPLLRSAEVNQTFDLITAYGSKFQNGDAHKTKSLSSILCQSEVREVFQMPGNQNGVGSSITLPNIQRQPSRPNYSQPCAVL